MILLKIIPIRVEIQKILSNLLRPMRYLVILRKETFMISSGRMNSNKESVAAKVIIHLIYSSHSSMESCSEVVVAVGYDRITIMQEKTFPYILKGNDVLDNAKTGTNKTLEFILNAIEVILKSPSVLRYEKMPLIILLLNCPVKFLSSLIFS